MFPPSLFQIINLTPMFKQRAIIGSLFEQELFCIMVFEVIRGLNHRWYFECVVKSAPSPKQVFYKFQVVSKPKHYLNIVTTERRHGPVV